MALGEDKPLFKIDNSILDQVVTVFGTPNEEEKKVMDLTSERANQLEVHGKKELAKMISEKRHHAPCFPGAAETLIFDLARYSHIKRLHGEKIFESKLFSYKKEPGFWDQAQDPIKCTGKRSWPK